MITNTSVCARAVRDNSYDVPTSAMVLLRPATKHKSTEWTVPLLLPIKSHPYQSEIAKLVPALLILLRL